MTRFMLLTGAAALAIGSAAAAGPAGQGNDKSAKAEHSHKQTAARRQVNARCGEMRAAKRDDRRSDVRAAQGGTPRRRSRDERRADRVERRDERKAERASSDRDDRRDLRRLATALDRRSGTTTTTAAASGPIGGCPPGLAKKAVPCMPPGQAKQLVGPAADAAFRQQAWRCRACRPACKSLYRDNDDYYYRTATAMCIRSIATRDLISSLLPLFGLGATIGQPFPSAYSNYCMPTALQSFYPNRSTTLPLRERLRLPGQPATPG